MAHGKYDGHLAFVDVADELVFAKVLDRFEAELQCVLQKLRAGETDTQDCAVQRTEPCPRASTSPQRR